MSISGVQITPDSAVQIAPDCLSKSAGIFSAQVWTEKEYATNAIKISSEQYILFIGNRKLIKDKRLHRQRQFSEYGMAAATIRRLCGTGQKKVVCADYASRREAVPEPQMRPARSGLPAQAFDGVIPGWHMNKEHWNSVIIGTNVPEDEIKRQVGNSYDLI